MDNSYLKERNFEEDIEQWLLDERAVMNAASR